MIKTPAEIEKLRRAALVNQKAMLDAIDVIREGVEHRAVIEKLRQGMVGEGATISHDACGFSWASVYSHTEASSYRAKKGDLFKFDIGCYLGGYAADTARTGVVGKPSPQQASHYAAVREAQQLGIEMLRPGMAASELYEIMQSSIRKNLRNPSFVRTNYGHGIGRDVYDLPTISASDHTPLETGMVLNIEAPDHELGFGGLTLEDTVLLNENGIEYFTDADRDLYVR
jgi:Xaa-Pro aminopeptidase